MNSVNSIISHEEKISPDTEQSTIEDEETVDQIYQTHLNEDNIDESQPIKHKFSISSNYLLFHTKDDQHLEGLLQKKSPNPVVGWQTRYCIVRNGKFYYYKDKHDLNFKGCVDFSLITVSLETIKKDNKLEQLIMHLQGAKRSFNFRNVDSQSKPTLEQWRQAILDNIQQATNSKSNIIFDEKVLCLQKEFWRNERISLQQFERDADTGDILLFSGKATMCKIQRAFTGDSVDHVAVLLRYNNGSLYIFESTGNVGVALCSWNRFLKNNWHTIYQKLVFRHLDIERSEDLVEKLESFIKVKHYLAKIIWKLTIGKKYKVNASKLIKKWRKSLKEDYERDDKTFFCSELVAATYKKMGLLPENICSTSYWPGSFSSQHKLPLLKGSLKNELLLDFTIMEKPQEQNQLDQF